jgi:hypothetical protein
MADAVTASIESSNIVLCRGGAYEMAGGWGTVIEIYELGGIKCGFVFRVVFFYMVSCVPTIWRRAIV